MLCVLYLTRHTIICVFTVLCCIVLWYTLLVLSAVWLWAMSCAASESHYCVWLTVVDETIAFKLRKSKDWLWFRYICSFFFFFLSHTVYLGTIMTSSSSKLEMKQMSIHFRKWWNIDFCLLVQCSLDFGHFCNGSKGGMPLTNTLQFMHLIDCSFNKTRSAALTWVFGSSNLPPASFYRGPV